MAENKMKSYKLKSVYEFVNIIYEYVEDGFDFWNFNGELFVQSALRFNKDSLLHIYVSSTLYCHYSRKFRKDGGLMELTNVYWWIKLLKEYGVTLSKRGFRYNESDAAWTWFQKNEDAFCQFFEIISEEVVYILFNDKRFLVQFNRLVRNVILDEDDSYSTLVEWPEGLRNKDGTIKRCTIPQWVKQAVYHRDKGRCVFCNRDLTGLVNTLNQKNFDHIIPLKDYGTNDPCNIQLTCEECNKKKGGKDKEPRYLYQSWW